MTKTLKLVAAVMAVALALGANAGMAEAKSKTKKAAEIAVKMLPIPAPAKALMRANLRIYDRAGYNLGRELVIRQYGPSADPGPYPGYNN